MRYDCLYRHVNNLTVAFQLIKAFYVREKQLWKLKVMWWNVSSRRAPHPINIILRIEIPNERIKEWKTMDFDELGPAPQHVHATFPSE